MIVPKKKDVRSKTVATRVTPEVHAELMKLVDKAQAKNLSELLELVILDFVQSARQ